MIMVMIIMKSKSVAEKSYALRKFAFFQLPLIFFIYKKSKYCTENVIKGYESECKLKSIF